MADRTRAWAAECFGLFSEETARSDTVSCVSNMHGINMARFVTDLASRGYGVSNGYGRLKEQTFRIGHMGEHTLAGLDALLRTMDEVLEEERA